MSTQRVSPPEVTAKKTVSARKLEANRRNGRKSTGPKTARGKNHSKKNALKHGLFSEDCLAQEDPRDLARLHKLVREELKPVGAQEESDVEYIVWCRWRLRRVYKVENAQVMLNRWERSHWTQRALLGPAEFISPSDDDFLQLCETAEREIQTRAMISAELKQIIAATWEYRSRITSYAKEFNIKQHAQEIAELMARRRGMPLSEAQQLLAEDCGSQPEYADVLTLTFMRVGRDRIRERAWSYDRFQRRQENVVNLIPNDGSFDQILRYEVIVERQLNRALDRLDRLQRRRKGEAPAPRLSLETN